MSYVGVSPDRAVSTLRREWQKLTWRPNKTAQRCDACVPSAATPSQQAVPVAGELNSALADLVVDLDFEREIRLQNPWAAWADWRNSLWLDVEHAQALALAGVGLLWLGTVVFQMVRRSQ